MSKRTFRTTGITGIMACVMCACALFLAPSAAASDCDQPCLEGYSCNPAYTTTPASHSGSHACGGSYSTDPHEGSCQESDGDDDCDQGTGRININTYICTPSGAGCTHTFSGYSFQSICSCS